VDGVTFVGANGDEGELPRSLEKGIVFVPDRGRDGGTWNNTVQDANE
jgi:hypothetical protein